jgi:hypothetical protein
MGFTISDTSGVKFDPAPAGAHIGICTTVIDLGTHVTPFIDERTGLPKRNRQVRIGWELPNCKREDGSPHGVATFYTLSLNEKSNLRKDLEAWRSREFTPQELKGFELGSILGKPCFLSVAHKVNAKGETRANVNSIMAVPQGMEVPAQVNPSVLFNIDEWDQAVFDGLSDFVKGQITTSEEYLRSGRTPLPAMTAQVNGTSVEGFRRVPASQAATAGVPITDDDIPFAPDFHCWGTF